jgi:SAM-dependent methyltransferase
MKFYDDLAGVYHLIYEDWNAAIDRQANVLARIVGRAQIVADVACGIGTQAIGLAKLGYNVIASDLSHAAVERAKSEAAARNVEIDFRVDDMARLSTYDDESVNALIACDNAIPHLLGDPEILGAFRQFHRAVRPGGTCVISVRDYDTLRQTRFMPFGMRTLPDSQLILLQVWEWDGDQYDLNFYFVRDFGDRVDAQVFRSRYYAASIATLIRLFAEAGFRDVRRIDGEFFQPLIVARRP